MNIENRELTAGTKLVARYKKQEHTCEVVEVDGAIRYRLADGREFKSPSSAGSAVMGGTACNGWRFWSVAGGGGHRDGGPEEEDQARGQSGQRADPADGGRPLLLQCLHGSLRGSRRPGARRVSPGPQAGAAGGGFPLGQNRQSSSSTGQAPRGPAFVRHKQAPLISRAYQWL